MKCLDLRWVSRRNSTAAQIDPSCLALRTSKFQTFRTPDLIPHPNHKKKKKKRERETAAATTSIRQTALLAKAKRAEKGDPPILSQVPCSRGGPPSGSRPAGGTGHGTRIPPCHAGRDGGNRMEPESVRVPRGREPGEGPRPRPLRPSDRDLIRQEQQRRHGAPADPQPAQRDEQYAQPWRN